MPDESKYASTKRVYETVGGVSRLKYPIGHPIPVEEARRQGLVGKTAKAPDAVTTTVAGEGVSVTYDRHERLGESEAEKAARNQAKLDAVAPTPAKKPTARKPAARKTAAKKAARKPPAKKPTARKPAARKTAAKKAARKPAAKKATAKPAADTS